MPWVSAAKPIGEQRSDAIRIDHDAQNPTALTLQTTAPHDLIPREGTALYIDRIAPMASATSSAGSIRGLRASVVARYHARCSGVRVSAIASMRALCTASSGPPYPYVYMTHHSITIGSGHASVPETTLRIHTQPPPGVARRTDNPHRLASVTASDCAPTRSLSR